MNNFILNKTFYTNPDTVGIAKSLLGKKLVTTFNGKITAGIICETEAYCGTQDRGCHAYNGRFTERTKVMYQEGSVSYVYLCYGVHYLFNVVTHNEGEPHAVLIRAIEPIEGITTMLKRRNMTNYSNNIGAGPGLVTQCLGITTKHNGISLMGDKIKICDAPPINPEQIIASPRVGMNFNGPYKLIPYRFRILNSPFTSKAK
jgi:DNA-3-methyladenine glycosylase